MCYNLDRMYNQTGAGATQAQYWSDVMGGFKGQVDDAGTPVPSVYNNCTADGNKAVITLTTATSKFPAVLGLPSFSIQSPTALKQYDANNVVAQGDSFVYPAYAHRPPDRHRAVQVPGVRQGQQHRHAGPQRRLLGREGQEQDARSSRSSRTRRRASRNCRPAPSTATTCPNPADWDGLKAAGFNVEVRPAFNILYLGINQRQQPGAVGPRVRQAIAYALNREQFVKSQLPDGAKVANIFYPDTVDGYTDDVTKYPYDPQKAKDLLAEAGASDLTVNFWWPTEVTRPYMPDPKSVFTAFKADLEAVGITVNETSKPGTAATWTASRPAGRTCSCSAGPATTTRRTTSSARSSPAPPNRFSTGTSAVGRAAVVGPEGGRRRSRMRPSATRRT